MKTRAMSTGLKLLMKNARHDKIAAYNAAALLEAGGRGHSAVQFFYLRSAERDYPPAMRRIAGFYFTGEFLQDEDEDGQERRFIQDNELGFQWLQRAAKLGDETSEYLLARCYLDGIGTRRDPVKAAYHLGRAVFVGKFNPYEPDEGLVFGSLSPELHACVRRRIMANALKSAG